MSREHGPRLHRSKKPDKQYHAVSTQIDAFSRNGYQAVSKADGGTGRAPSAVARSPGAGRRGAEAPQRAGMPTMAVRPLRTGRDPASTWAPPPRSAGPEGSDRGAGSPWRERRRPGPSRSARPAVRTRCKIGSGRRMGKSGVLTRVPTRAAERANTRKWASFSCPDHWPVYLAENCTRAWGSVVRSVLP
jgi:hypothetical protein